MLQAASQKSPRQPAPSVTVHRGRLSYGGRLLFDDIDLSLRAGETTCLLGPSGVGKTSLLRLIAGLAEGVAGEVSAGDGRPIADRIAYMAQQDLLLPWSSLLDNVLLGPRLRGTLGESGVVERARALIAQVGLAGHEAERPAQLSSGMRQRVALARTLMEDRPLVLMDEPFSALDAITRFELQDLAARLLADRTVLLVTHDPLEALRLGHRVHVLAGRPAKLDTALAPAGPVPRDPSDPDLLALQGELLKRLTQARAAA